MNFQDKIAQIIDAINTEIPYFSTVGFAGYQRVIDGNLVTYLDNYPVSFNERICYLRYDGNTQYATAERRKSCNSILASTPVKIIAQLPCIDVEELERKLVFELAGLIKGGDLEILQSNTDTRQIYQSETGQMYDGTETGLLSIDIRINTLFDSCENFELCTDCCE